MNRCVVTKRIIQGVAVAFGVLGVMLAFMGLGFAVTGFRQSDRFMQFFMTPMFLALGGITVAIAWVNLRHFGAGAIRHITALVVVSVYLWLPPWMEPLEWTTINPMMNLLLCAAHLLSLFLVYWLYRALSRKLIQLAGLESGEQGDSTLLSDAASDAPSERG